MEHRESFSSSISPCLDPVDTRGQCPVQYRYDNTPFSIPVSPQRIFLVKNLALSSRKYLSDTLSITNRVSFFFVESGGLGTGVLIASRVHRLTDYLPGICSRAMVSGCETSTISKVDNVRILRCVNGWNSYSMLLIAVTAV
jgi:hypothetical protein